MWEKINLGPQLTPHRKLNSKYAIALKIKAITIKFFQVNIGENLSQDAEIYLP